MKFSQKENFKILSNAPLTISYYKNECDVTVIYLGKTETLHCYQFVENKCPGKKDQVKMLICT